MNPVFTIMVITFGAGPFAGYDTYIPYSTSYLCGNNIERQRDELEADGFEVTMIRCLKTDIKSGESK